jgi:hypothetical protein
MSSKLRPARNQILLWLWLITVAALLALAYSQRVDLHRRITQRLGGPSKAFIGDSITAGGEVWDWRLGRPSFETGNFGQGSAGLRVISWIARVRVIPANHISVVSIMAGSNDGPSSTGPLSFRGDVDAAFAEYVSLLDYLKGSGVLKVVITSAPPGRDAATTRFLAQLNARIAAHAAKDPIFTYVDLWPSLSAGDQLKPEMTVDGVHFNKAAYGIWAAELRKHL